MDINLFSSVNGSHKFTCANKNHTLARVLSFVLSDATPVFMSKRRHLVSCPSSTHTQLHH